MVPSAVVSTAVMTVAAIAGILILVNGSITISTVLAYAVYVAASVPETGPVLIAGSIDTRRAVANASVLAYAVHITEIIAGAVTIFIAGSVDWSLFRHSFRCYGCRSRGSICQSFTVCRTVCCRTIIGHG